MLAALELEEIGVRYGSRGVVAVSGELGHMSRGTEEE